MKKLLNGIILAGIALCITGTLQAPTTPITAPKLHNTPSVVSSASYEVPETPKPVTVATTPTVASNVGSAASTSYTGSHEDWMSAAGIAPSDYAAVDYIISHESGWRPAAEGDAVYVIVNGVSTLARAYGLCQSLPSWKMASAGADYLTNPTTQLKWCNSYAQARYGGWWAAQAYWVANHNW